MYLLLYLIIFIFQPKHLFFITTFLNNNEYQAACEYLKQYRNGTITTGCKYGTDDVILLILHHHWKKTYSSTDFAVNTYILEFSKLFKYNVDLVIVGSEKNETYKIHGTGIKIGGRYSFQSFSYIYNIYKPLNGFNYYGYLFFNDDSCLLPLRLNSFNFDKSFTEDSRANLFSNTSWYFVNLTNDYGVTYYQSIVDALKQLNLNMIPKYGWSDMFYVHKNQAEKVKSLFDVMYKNQVFMEIAIQTALTAVGAVQLKTCNHIKRRPQNLCVHIHPLKFSKIKDRNTCIKKLKTFTF